MKSVEFKSYSGKIECTIFRVRMIRFFFVSLFFLSSFFSFGQVTYVPKLELQLDTAKGIYRVTILNHLAEVLIETDVVKADKYANEALVVATELGNPFGISKANLLIGMVLYKQGDYKKAIIKFLEGYKHANGIGSASLQRDNLRMIAESYASSEDFEKGYEYYKKYSQVHETVNEKQKQYLEQQAKDFQPSIELTMRNESGFAVIKIRDNGMGIESGNLDKVFQPFFTTKPTRRGSTGMGLSVSHEIVHQIHNGFLFIDSEFGVFAEVTIKLPL